MFNIKLHPNVSILSANSTQKIARVDYLPFSFAKRKQADMSPSKLQIASINDLSEYTMNYFQQRQSHPPPANCLNKDMRKGIEKIEVEIVCLRDNVPVALKACHAELLQSASSGNMNMLEFLCQRLPEKAVYVVGDVDGDTALHLAMKNSRFAAAKFLVSKEPEAAYKLNSQKESPLYLAVKCNNEELVRLMPQSLHLVSKPTKQNLLDNYHHTPIAHVVIGVTPNKCEHELQGMYQESQEENFFQFQEDVGVNSQAGEFSHYQESNVVTPIVAVSEVNVVPVVSVQTTKGNKSGMVKPPWRP